MKYRTFRIIPIVQARVDAFLKEIFDLCESSEESMLLLDRLGAKLR